MAKVNIKLMLATSNLSYSRSYTYEQPAFQKPIGISDLSNVEKFPHNEWDGGF
jgi:hypothetical protein